MKAKLIAFDCDLAKKSVQPKVDGLWVMVNWGVAVTAIEVRNAGLPVAKVLIERAIGNQTIKEMLKSARVSQIAVAPGILIPEMVNIPAGSFPMGSTEYDDEKPIRKVTITKPFALGKYEVTNAEWKSFCEATGRGISEIVADPDKARHPIVNVSWYDAVAYAQWLSEATGDRYRLPTEAEWEYAARGPEGLKYPWGNKWDAAKVTFNTNDGTRPVDAHPEGASPFSVIDMSGNVWEWVADTYQPYNPEDLVDPKVVTGGGGRVLRGGSWYDVNQVNLRGANRGSNEPQGQRNDFGFRVAQDL